MKAVCWMGKGKIETAKVSDPILLNPHDAIIKITRTAIEVSFAEESLKTKLLKGVAA